MSSNPPSETPFASPVDPHELGDFTTDRRVLLLSLIAVGIGALASVVALALLDLIALCTNLFFFQRWSIAPVSPAANHLGWMVVFVPVIGALIIGVMARYGSERIRGHGIPEAIESILINGSRVEPRVALLKPLSAAISIGSGGPFGAEGPIIMTGGAFGSLVAQAFHLTNAERKTLLVAGAAAGMSATFAAPLAAVLLAVELLLFEWKPRSVIPVALASATAAILRRDLLGAGPIFATPVHHPLPTAGLILAALLVGIAAGAFSALLTRGVYAVEDFFGHLPFHWMWWPALGGLTIGLGGVIFPQALGVGYDTIAALLHGDVPERVIVGVLLVKSAIWIVALGSGTSGGVLAPLLMMGGALGGLESGLLPAVGDGFWPLISMAAILGGTMRVPFTAVVFAIELTGDFSSALPLLVAVTGAYAFTVLLLPRSILTEKISRRGYHLSREYSIDPLEILFAREVMRTSVVALPVNAPVHALEHSLAHDDRRQRLYPVVDADEHLLGVVTRTALHDLVSKARATGDDVQLKDAISSKTVVAWPDEPLRSVAQRMAESGLTRFPVVTREHPRRLLGMIGLPDLLRARALNLDAERRRERVLPLRIAVPSGLRTLMKMARMPD
jgi:chloride channel protein, CIC family